MFFTNASRLGVSVHYQTLPGSIEVLESLDNLEPIGMASEAGCNNAGLALWALTIHGAEFPGRWTIVDQQFMLEPDQDWWIVQTHRR